MASENIAFDQIPASIRKPGKYFEFNTKLAVRTLPQNRQKVLIVGQRLSTGSVAELVPADVFSDVQAAEYFGYGSQAHLMALAAITANPYLSLSICALDDNVASVAATGSITITGSAAASGTGTLWVGNQAVQVGISKDDTAAAIATALVAAIGKVPSLPITAAVNGSTPEQIDITAKNSGVVGNSIGLGWEVTNQAVSTTIVAMSGGSGDPDVASALAAVFGEQYNIIATPYNDQTSLQALRDHLDSVSGPLEQRPGTGYYGMTGALADATTLAGNINSGRVAGALLRGTRSLPMEVAGAFAGVKAFEEDPARPLNTLSLKGIHAPDVDQRLSRTEQENCLYNGVTPLEVGAGGKVQIVRAISTYMVDAQGINDISLLDITSICTLDYVRRACRERVALRFPRSKLSSKTPPNVRSELYDVLLKLEALEIVENVEEHADKLIVERDLQDPNRLNAAIPTDVVNGLHVFAGRLDMIL
jgi:phage tail sheath gpL-like